MDTDGGNKFTRGNPNHLLHNCNCKLNSLNGTDFFMKQITINDVYRKGKLYHKKGKLYHKTHLVDDRYPIKIKPHSIISDCCDEKYELRKSIKDTLIS